MKLGVSIATLAVAVIFTTSNNSLAISESRLVFGETYRALGSAHEPLLGNGDHKGSGENGLSNHLKSRSAIEKFLVFNTMKLRVLKVDHSQGFKNLMLGAKLDNENKKRIIFSKQGNFQQAIKGFNTFNPYDIQNFQLPGKRYGVSGKLKDGSDVQEELENIITSELGIVVRSWSGSPPNYPTLEIFPIDMRESSSFLLRMRYVEN